MDVNALTMAHQVITMLEFYRAHYADSQVFVDKKRELVMSLKNISSTGVDDAPFISAFSDAIDKL